MSKSYKTQNHGNKRDHALKHNSKTEIRSKNLFIILKCFVCSWVWRSVFYPKLYKKI